MSSPADAPLPRRLPAEWEPHEATWIAWPHHEPDWEGKFETVGWVYAEIVRLLSEHERVEILCHDDAIAERARSCLDLHHVDATGYRLHLVPTDRSWLRDSGPTFVPRRDGSLELIDWRFDAWSKYDNHRLDDRVPAAVERITGLPRVEAHRPDEPAERLVLEGGAFDTDGLGTLLVTEECLLSTDVQVRNRGLDRTGYERAFAEYLGIRQTIWLGRGCAGDDTHGHVDDVARFVAPGTVVLAYEEDSADENHAASVDNLDRLARATNARGRSLRVVKLPMPRPVIYEGLRLPASYANFYVANRLVLVPTFNDPDDRVALNTLAHLFADRQVVGVAAVDLVLGMGTLHCLTQPQPTGHGQI